MGVTKVSGPTEASHVSHLEALEPDVLWDHFPKHMVAIFTEGLGCREGKNGGMKEHRAGGEGILEGKRIFEKGVKGGLHGGRR